MTISRLRQAYNSPTQRGEYLRNYVKISRLGFPILVGQLGMIVVGFADNAMIGHYSTDSLAASSFVVNVFNLAILFCLGFTYGLTPLIGALYSISRNEDIGATLRRGVRVNIVVAIIATLVMGVLYFNLDRLGQPEHLLPLIRPYYLLYLAGILPISLMNTFAQWASAINSTKMPMWIVLASNIVNIIGNYLLIYGIGFFPEMGLIGAGISTLIARWICPIAIFIIFLRVKRYHPYHNGFFRNHSAGETTAKIVRTSFPISMQLGFETSSFSIAAIMAGWLGSVQLASYQIIVTVGTLGFCLYYGLATAVSVLVANESTDGGAMKMRRVAFAGYHLLLIMSAISSALFIFFGQPLIDIFTDDPAVKAMTLSLIFPLVLYQIADASQINFANALRGTANVVPMAWIAFFSYVIIGIPATYIITFPLGLDIFGIVLSFSVSLLCAAALFIFFFLRTTRRLAEQENRIKKVL